MGQFHYFAVKAELNIPSKSADFVYNISTLYLGGFYMTFEELMDYAISRDCSDVHITQGTNLAVRRYGELHIRADRQQVVHDGTFPRT